MAHTKRGKVGYWALRRFATERRGEADALLARNMSMAKRACAPTQVQSNLPDQAPGESGTDMMKGDDPGGSDT